jgi:diguanylate cyclase (GGDEF)-like protein
MPETTVEGIRERENGDALASRIRGRRVLIVDDDHAQVLTVERGLAHHGYEFAEAGDGHSALIAVREEHPDLILMDVEMPGLSGVEVCRIIKANQAQGFGFIPVILMTARQQTAKIKGLELGADDFLVKPFDMLELSARVKSMLRLKLLQDALLEKNRELDRANKELDKKRQELLALSRTDALTGLFNRRYFEERLSREFARSSRYRTPLSCMMVDIDFFKRLNDQYGHAFGDRVLRKVAWVARESLRDVDLIARYGGEEFIALLPETGPQQALLVSERVRDGIASLQFEQSIPNGTSALVSCTVSVGVATYPDARLDSAEALLRAADQCLYAAKAAGKNAVRQHHA